MSLPPPMFWQGIEEFNQRQFYACHDTLEAIWLEASGEDQKFYQGILQVAVACYHLGNHNWRGAVILLGEGIRRLVDYQPSYYGIDVQSLLQQSNNLLHSLQLIQPEQIAEFILQLENQQLNSRQATPPTANLTMGCQLPQIVKLSAAD